MKIDPFDLFEYENFRFEYIQYEYEKISDWNIFDTNMKKFLIPIYLNRKFKCKETS